MMMYLLLTCLQMSFSDATLSTTVAGDYSDTNPLANITIAGWGGTAVPSLQVSIGGSEVDCSGVTISLNANTLYIQNLQDVFGHGAWAQDSSIKFQDGS